MAFEADTPMFNCGVAVGSRGAGVALLLYGTSDIKFAGRHCSALVALAAALDHTKPGSIVRIGTNDIDLLAAITPPYGYSDRAEWWAVIQRIAVRRIQRIEVRIEQLPKAMEILKYGDEIATPKTTFGQSAGSVPDGLRVGGRRRKKHGDDAGTEQLRPSLLQDWTAG